MKTARELFAEKPMTPERLEELMVETARVAKELARQSYRRSRHGEFDQDLEESMSYLIHEIKCHCKGK